ncbi:MAG: ABC-2 family transporter protein, partial [Myxococcaceae bacterium]|nr:ABC-2 family transporter protein [Myxococcaceae bacterium]
MWGVWLLAVAGGWAITFLVGIAIGSLAFFMEQSLKIMDVWLAMFFVLSGYLIPISLFPPQVARILDWLPWRYQIGFAVEVMTRRHDWHETLMLLGRQWGWVAVLALAAVSMWRLGVKRFAAYGG